MAKRKRKGLSERESRFLESWGIAPFPTAYASVRAIAYIKNGNGTYGDSVAVRASFVIAIQKEWTNVRVKDGHRTGTSLFPFFLYYREIADRNEGMAALQANLNGTSEHAERRRLEAQSKPRPYRLMVRWDTKGRGQTTPIPVSSVERIADSSPKS